MILELERGMFSVEFHPAHTIQCFFLKTITLLDERELIVTKNQFAFDTAEIVFLAAELEEHCALILFIDFHSAD